MHIKVINSEKSVFREANIYINVVQNIDNHVISADSGTVAATRGQHAISYYFMTFTVTTPKEYTVTIKKWGESPYVRQQIIDNRRAISDWLIYAKAAFGLGNVGVRVDSYNYTLDIFVFNDSVVYIDDKVVYEGVTNAD